jgi:hypothetical protein
MCDNLPMATSAGGIAVDLSGTVLLSQFRRAVLRALFVVLAVSPLWWHQSRSVFPFAFAAGIGACYIAVRRLPIPTLRQAVWLFMVASGAAAIEALWKAAVSLWDAELPAERAAMFALILALFAIGRLVGQKQELVPDEATVRDTSVPFATERPLSETWAALGWPLAVVSWVLCLPLLLTVQNHLLAELWFACGVGCIAAIGWLLVPVRNALTADFPLELLRAIDAHNSQARHGNYASFACRLIYRRLVKKIKEKPVSIFWATACLLSWSAAVWLVGRFNVTGPYQMRAIPSYLLAIAGIVFFEKSGWNLHRPTVLAEVEDLSTLARIKLVAIHAGLTDPCSEVTLRKALNEPFILYLRSFEDDPFEVLRDGIVYRLLLATPAQQFNNWRFLSLERIIADAVWRFGKLVAVGKPAQWETASGAAPEAALRIEVQKDWQSSVAAWIREADYVVMTAGDTEGVRWEVQQLKKSGGWDKLVLVLRHDKPAAMVRTWRRLFENVPRLASCSEEMIASSMAVRFSGGRLPLFFSVSRRSVAAYKVALNACLLPFEQVSALHAEEKVSPVRAS